MSNDSGSSTIPTPIIKAMGPAGGPSIQRDAQKANLPASAIRRMNLNECPYPPSPKAIAAMQAACAVVNYYPDPKWRDLVAALAARTGFAENRIIIGNGSDEAIVQAGRVALMPGDEVIAPVPSFPGYYKCREVNGGALVPVKVREDGANDVDAMLAAVTDRTRIVFCATPNNPTGAMITAAEVERLATGLPDTVLLVLDEAYHEFGMHAGGEDLLPAMAKRTGPWVVFRTFSKAYGLAGIRVGYVLCGSDEMAESFQKVRSVFNVNAVGQAGALAALDDMEHVQGILDATAQERGRIVEGLKKLGFDPFPTVGNFVTAKGPNPAADVVGALEERGIMISRLMAPGYENYIRVTVARPEDTDALLAALSEIMG
ncbi:MAG: histidinol-phosphate aminotransferase family protein [Rhodospirillaceae bacterium]|nr:histidinol-phosphate aminotransferase family protein [Rhodospirillaceae bacterium]MBT6139844.1 histidinol-phosphate aminotransferase family protein [Rhodospirillaceae bacterium]